MLAGPSLALDGGYGDLLSFKQTKVAEKSGEG